MQCVTCRHFQSTGQNVGLCKFGPPTAIDVATSLWPVVTATDGCGQHALPPLARRTKLSTEWILTWLRSECTNPEMPSARPEGVNMALSKRLFIDRLVQEGLHRVSAYRRLATLVKHGQVMEGKSPFPGDETAFEEGELALWPGPIAGRTAAQDNPGRPTVCDAPRFLAAFRTHAKAAKGLSLRESWRFVSATHALSLSTAKKLMDQLVAAGSVERGEFGYRLQPPAEIDV